MRLLSPGIAAAYAKVTERTLNRDIADLEEIGLVERTRTGIRARKEIILGFLSPSRDDETDADA